MAQTFFAFWIDLSDALCYYNISNVNENALSTDEYFT